MKVVDIFPYSETLSWAYLNTSDYKTARYRSPIQQIALIFNLKVEKNCVILLTWSTHIGVFGVNPSQKGPILEGCTLFALVPVAYFYRERFVRTQTDHRRFFVKKLWKLPEFSTIFKFCQIRISEPLCRRRKPEIREK